MNRNERAYWLGMRVQLHPGTDAWMRGDRYGDVVKVGRTFLHVKMDRSGVTRRVSPANVMLAGE